ncbi:MAG: FtsQ-type POTRA domain-containing protein [Bacteroidota bacterium]|nr:FtsQ-type POTRA domain-containing protein [Bacteroidota bacterium]
MQIHIHKKNTDPEGSDESRGYSPLHEARVLNEFSEMDQGHLPEPDEADGWRSSRRIPFMLFCIAVVLFLGITYVAKQFQSEENLQGVVVQGNSSLLTSEVLSLASIDMKQKFYDIDLRQIEQRIEKHGLVRNAILRRESRPDRIIIQIEEREPIAMFRSQSGEPILVDREYKFFLPKRLSGLKNPDKLLSVPILGGITERDTAAILQMSKMVQMIRTINGGALRDAVGELRRTSTGAYVIYTAATLTPIFIGSPQDEPFRTSLEVEADRNRGIERKESLFVSQITLLAKLWLQTLKDELWHNGALYVDARFDGDIIIKKRGAYAPHPVPTPDSAKGIAANLTH